MQGNLVLLIFPVPAGGAARTTPFFSVLVLTEPLCYEAFIPRVSSPICPPGAWSASKWSGLLPATELLVRRGKAATAGRPSDKLSVNNAARTSRTRFAIINNHRTAFYSSQLISVNHTDWKWKKSKSRLCNSAVITTLVSPLMRMMLIKNGRRFVFFF